MNCAFCDNPVQNQNKWPICKRCYDSGKYYSWVVEELENGNTDPKMLEAYHFMRKDGGLMMLLKYPPDQKFRAITS